MRNSQYFTRGCKVSGCNSHLTARIFTFFGDLAGPCLGAPADPACPLLYTGATALQIAPGWWLGPAHHDQHTVACATTLKSGLPLPPMLDWCRHARVWECVPWCSYVKRWPGLEQRAARWPPIADVGCVLYLYIYIYFIYILYASLSEKNSLIPQ